MKIAGHTLGTPGMTVPEALKLFADAGLDAAEIIWQEGYTAAIPETGAATLLKETRQVADDLGLDIAGLTPYMSAYNSLDEVERLHDLDRLRRCIDDAVTLGCRHIRVYAGSFKPGDDRRDEKWARLVESMHVAGEIAHTAGVTLCVENHFNTMTVTAAETVALMEAVHSPGVGILYDQANLVFTHSEPYEVAIPLQAAWIRHVHVKDLIFIDPTRPFTADAVARVKAEDRAIRSRVVGEGILEWPNILKALRAVGYDGYLSLEYEYRWHPQDLPEPAVGFRAGGEAVRRILQTLE
ncbi:MAG: hypothetical protein Kow00124_11980 [Anaerolineae bacterium]